jgi:hypothetical protein
MIFFYSDSEFVKLMNRVKELEEIVGNERKIVNEYDQRYYPCFRKITKAYEVFPSGLHKKIEELEKKISWRKVK